MYNMKQVAHITTIIIPAIYTSLCVGIVMFPWNEVPSRVDYITGKRTRSIMYLTMCLRVLGIGTPSPKLWDPLPIDIQEPLHGYRDYPLLYNMWIPTKITCLPTKLILMKFHLKL